MHSKHESACVCVYNTFEASQVEAFLAWLSRREEIAKKDEIRKDNDERHTAVDRASAKKRRAQAKEEGEQEEQEQGRDLEEEEDAGTPMKNDDRNSSSARKGRPCKWNDFQQQMNGRGFTKEQLKIMYSEMKEGGEPGEDKEMPSPKPKSAKKKGLEASGSKKGKKREMEDEEEEEEEEDDGGKASKSGRGKRASKLAAETSMLGEDEEEFDEGFEEEDYDLLSALKLKIKLVYHEMEFRQKVEVKFARETERWGYTNRSKKEKIHHSCCQLEQANTSWNSID
jgi:hypothetical protein